MSWRSRRSGSPQVPSSPLSPLPLSTAAPSPPPSAALALVLSSATQRLERTASSSSDPPASAWIAQLLLPFWAVDVLLLAGLAWQVRALGRRRAAGLDVDVAAVRRAVALAAVLAIALPSEVVLAVSDATGGGAPFRVDAILGALVALSGTLAGGACCLAAVTCRRTRARDALAVVLAQATGDARGTRSCRTKSPSRQGGLGGHLIVVMHAPGLSPVEM